MNTYHIRRQALRDFAEFIIESAGTVSSALHTDPDLQSMSSVNRLDRESWHVARDNARKIVAAVETGQVVDLKWLDGIHEALRKD